MAVDLREKMLALIQSQLDRKLRYRCLVLQTADVGVLSRLSDYAKEFASALGEGARVIPYASFIDDVGAMSCNKVIETIDGICGASPLVLAGPLNFLNYWSEQMQGAFWKHLAGFTHGPGIIVSDTPREDVSEGPFRLVAKIPGTDIRYLKSRLASTQDGLV
jgi:hypothetical protein